MRCQTVESIIDPTKVMLQQVTSLVLHNPKIEFNPKKTETTPKNTNPYPDSYQIKLINWINEKELLEIQEIEESKEIVSEEQNITALMKELRTAQDRVLKIKNELNTIQN
jgi:hypothetical protein